MSRGDGSVYRRADGMWVGAYVLPNGRRRYKYAKTQRDVREKLRRLRIRVEQGRPVEDDRRTVAEYLQWWIKELRRSETVRYSTWQSYETKVRLHLIPTLGRYQLGKLRPIHVQEMMSAKRQEGCLPGRCSTSMRYYTERWSKHGSGSWWSATWRASWTRRTSRSRRPVR